MNGFLTNDQNFVFMPNDDDHSWSVTNDDDIRTLVWKFSKDFFFFSPRNEGEGCELWVEGDKGFKEIIICLSCLCFGLACKVDSYFEK